MPLGALACLTWLIVAAITRMSSLAALITFLFAPALALGCGHPGVALLCMPIFALIVWKHAANIARLRAGTEPKIGKT